MDKTEFFKLVCVRHGESAWNHDNRFCGWVDVALSENGIKEAQEAADAVRKASLVFDTVFTSVLKRAINTADIIVNGYDEKPKRIVKHWRLNERHYGGLTGFNKAKMVEIYGKEQVQIWRRSFDVPPPPMDKDHKFYKAIVENENLANVVPEFPEMESLKDLIARTLPYWHSDIAPAIRKGERVLIVAHGTSLRGLVKHLEGLSDEAVTKLNLPTGIPFVYNLDRTTLKPVGPVQYLAEEEKLKKAVDKVTNIAAKK